VKIFVDILAEHYGHMLNLVSERSPVRAILMNGVVVHEARGRVRVRVVKILCAKAEAELLLEAANTVCPEATEEIEQSIARSATPF
jgi:hypothetical protein